MQLYDSKKFHRRKYIIDLVVCCAGLYMMMSKFVPDTIIVTLLAIYLVFFYVVCHSSLNVAFCMSFVADLLHHLMMLL